VLLELRDFRHTTVIFVAVDRQPKGLALRGELAIDLARLAPPRAAAR
jgi:hypothetical protein